jgi:hypothetical protein
MKWSDSTRSFSGGGRQSASIRKRAARAETVLRHHTQNLDEDPSRVGVLVEIVVGIRHLLDERPAVPLDWFSLLRAVDEAYQTDLGPEPLSDTPR